MKKDANSHHSACFGYLQRILQHFDIHKRMASKVEVYPLDLPFQLPKIKENYYYLVFAVG
jgi:hypothetical protein